jgi:hypothetical protein
MINRQRFAIHANGDHRIAPVEGSQRKSCRKTVH